MLWAFPAEAFFGAYGEKKHGYFIILIVSISCCLLLDAGHRVFSIETVSNDARRSKFVSKDFSS